MSNSPIAATSATVSGSRSYKWFCYEALPRNIRDVIKAWNFDPIKIYRLFQGDFRNQPQALETALDHYVEVKIKENEYDY